MFHIKQVGIAESTIVRVQDYVEVAVRNALITPSLVDPSCRSQ